MKKSYTCPYCKKKQKTIDEWLTTSIANERLLDGSYANRPVKFGKSVDFECFACPHCGKDLPGILIEELGF